MINLHLKEFDIDEARGFLPSKDPLIQLPTYFQPWENLLKNLSKLLILEKVKLEILNLPFLDVDKLKNQEEINRAMLVLSYLGHSYVWGGKVACDKLPSNISVPWYEVANHLGRPPVLSYASHALYNWKLYNQNEPIDLNNIIRLENFFGGIDEDWFVLIHIAIEAKAAPGIEAILLAFDSIKNNNIANLIKSLNTISNTLKILHGILKRMTEKCDPYIYYNRVRAFIFGWMNNPELPNGVFYEGVKEWKGVGQKFRGETGAQSSIIPSLDSALGLDFNKESPLYLHLLGLRDYMPKKHKEFIGKIEELEKIYGIRKFVINNKINKELVQAYNICLDGIYLFREIHFNYALNYINRQAEKAGSPINTGTGGTPLVKYLKQHVDDVLNAKISL